MPARRLPAAPDSGEERARVTFTFDGRPYEGVEGEPLAVSLLAAGRRTLSRSFRFHRPRGLMCSTGQCGWCECEVDGRPSVRTCRVPVREGMVVRGEHAWPSVEHDLLAALDLGSRFVPPTFYHHRFLRPRRLRKAYLDVLRWFGGRGRLGVGLPPERRSRVLRREEPDVLVVGGGRGGLLAAIGAAEAGARVVVLDGDADGEEGARADVATLMIEARALGVEVRAGTTATGWYAGLVTATDDDAIWEARPGAVVAATGTYESVPTVPGSDRPGVMSARLAARLVARYRVLPGARILIVGAGDELEAVGAQLRGAGADVVGPIPTSSLRAIGGRGSVGSARFLDDSGRPRREHVDAVVFGDRTPNVDLVLAAGGRVGWFDGRLAPEVDRDGRTSVPGLFVAGGAASPDPAGADAGSRQAGRAAARFARDARGGEDDADGAAWTATRTGDPARSSAAGEPPRPGAAHAVLCFCEDVRGWEIQGERAAGYTDPELVKRRTGALTGPCQGKYCLTAVTCAMQGTGPAASGPEILLPTGRPPLRPIRLGDLIAQDVTTHPDAAGTEGSPARGAEGA